jgi:hypothetical protein
MNWHFFLIEKNILLVFVKLVFDDRASETFSKIGYWNLNVGFYKAQVRASVSQYTLTLMVESNPSLTLLAEKP